MAGSARSRPAILTVDDDTSVLEAFHIILDDNYEVLEARDALRAMSVLQSRRVDLILLDIVMHGDDGITLLERLRTASARVPVIVVSGIDAAAPAATAMRLGALDYLTKPFDEERLLASIDFGLGRRVRLPAASTSARAVRRARIVLAGCEAGLAASVSVALRRVNDVECFGTATELARHLRDVRPDLVVVDANGVHDGGAELVSLVNSTRPFAPVILVESSVFPADPRATLLGDVRVRRPYGASELITEMAARLSPADGTIPSFSDMVLRIIEHVGANFATACVQDLGRVVGRRSYNLSRRFRRETGMTVKTFVNRVRVDVARQRLGCTREKIDTVATQVGCHDASHLSRLFLQYTGVRPGEVRRLPAAWPLTGT